MRAAKSLPTPKYQRQKTKSGDRAFVKLCGQRFYLGAHGSAESHIKYATKIAEWKSAGGRVVVPSDCLTIAEALAAFWPWVENYYGEVNGGVGKEVDCFKQAMRPLARLYGDSRAAEFGPRKLRVVRQEMVDRGWSRPYINQQTTRIKRLFKWCASEEMLSADIYHSLQTCPGLKRGRTTAREPTPIQPISDEIVRATVAHATPTLAAMITVHRASGMRPGELIIMRTRDLDMSGETWVYTPEFHKTQHHGHSRTIHLGRRSQDAIRPLLRADPDGYIFSPIRSEDERREVANAERVTPESCGNTPGSNRKRHPKWGPKAKYTTQTYARAIAYTCQRAFPAPDGVEGEALKQWHRDHKWTPHRLRHSFATECRKSFGLEGAQVSLGHSSARITEVYAERDQRLALEVARKIG